jgi:hypothetical protein
MAACRELEKALASGEPLPAGLEAHAGSCAACARELSEWRAIAAAAPALRKAWPSPELWPEIHQSLAEESQRAPAPSRGWLRLLPTAAIVALFAIATAGLWVFRDSGGRDPLARSWQTTKDPLLTERAVDEVEAAEKTYLASIENLSKLAQPRLSSGASPVMLNYREKLALLDSAIADLQAGIDQNRFNTHLRRELLAVYREKQQTLQNLMKEVPS